MAKPHRIRPQLLRPPQSHQPSNGLPANTRSPELSYFLRKLVDLEQIISKIFETGATSRLEEKLEFAFELIEQLPDDVTNREPFNNWWRKKLGDWFHDYSYDVVLPDSTAPSPISHHQPEYTPDERKDADFYGREQQPIVGQKPRFNNFRVQRFRQRPPPGYSYIQAPLQVIYQSSDNYVPPPEQPKPIDQAPHPDSNDFTLPPSDPDFDWTMSYEQQDDSQQQQIEDNNSVKTLADSSSQWDLPDSNSALNSVQSEPPQQHQKTEVKSMESTKHFRSIPPNDFDSTTTPLLHQVANKMKLRFGCRGRKHSKNNLSKAPNDQEFQNDRASNEFTNHHHKQAQEGAKSDQLSPDHFIELFPAPRDDFGQSELEKQLEPTHVEHEQEKGQSQSDPSSFIQGLQGSNLNQPQKVDSNQQQPSLLPVPNMPRYIYIGPNATQKQEIAKEIHALPPISSFDDVQLLIRVARLLRQAEKVIRSPENEDWILYRCLFDHVFDLLPCEQMNAYGAYEEILHEQDQQTMATLCSFLLNHVQAVYKRMAQEAKELPSNIMTDSNELAKLKCIYCHDQGHVKENCFMLKNAFCVNCIEEGHDKQRCYKNRWNM